MRHRDRDKGGEIGTDLEPLVLQDLLDGDVVVLLGANEPGLEYDTERTIANDFAVRIRYLSCFGGLAIRGYDLDNFVRIIYSWRCAKGVTWRTIEGDVEAWVRSTMNVG